MSSDGEAYNFLISSSKAIYPRTIQDFLNFRLVIFFGSSCIDRGIDQRTISDIYLLKDIR